MKNPRGFANIGLIVVLVVIVGAGVVWYLSNNSASNPANQINEIEQIQTVQNKPSQPAATNPQASIDASSLTANAGQSTITITGTANTKSLAVSIITTSAGYTGYTTLTGNGNVPVVNGHWSYTFSTSGIDAGIYKVEVGIVNADGTVKDLAVGALTVTQSSIPPLTDGAHPITAAPMSGKAPLTVTFRGYSTVGDTWFTFGDGEKKTDYYYCSSDNKECPTFTHTYTTPGTYTAAIHRTTPSTELGSVTIVVQ